MKAIFAMAALAAVAELAAWTAQAADAKLEIVVGKETREFSQTAVLSRPDIRTISVTGSVYHERRTRFQAVPLVNLLRGLAVPDGAMIQCDGTDGFSALLDGKRLLSTDPQASEALLAVEDPADPWPVLAGRTTSAGPFYLVWLRPQASAIGREEWPFNIASFHVVGDARSRFPAMYPADDAPRGVQAGVKSFQKNCFACHKMNGAGAAAIGPDLNLPRNPTEYFNPKALAVFIRDPAQLRSWPAMTMRGFSQAAIPDGELKDLVAYLRYMSGRKAGG